MYLKKKTSYISLLELERTRFKVLFIHQHVMMLSSIIKKDFRILVLTSDVLTLYN